jgi:hypothetical protein
MWTHPIGCANGYDTVTMDDPTDDPPGFAEVLAALTGISQAIDPAHLNRAWLRLLRMPRARVLRHVALAAAAVDPSDAGAATRVQETLALLGVQKTETREPRHLLILDLDETLVHATKMSLTRPPDFVAHSYNVYIRPHLVYFLSHIFEWFDVAVWSSAGADYLTTVVNHIFPQPAALKFVWAGDRCTLKRSDESDDYYWVKNLKKVKRAGYALDRVLIVDDTPEKAERNYGNYIRIAPFTGEADDEQLLRLIPYLWQLRRADSLRSIEKRSWNVW